MACSIFLRKSSYGVYIYKGSQNNMQSSKVIANVKLKPDSFCFCLCFNIQTLVHWMISLSQRVQAWTRPTARHLGQATS